MSERCDEKLFTIKQVLIPLTDAPWAVVQVPVPMTEENWEELERFLALIKKPVTYHPTSPLEV